MKAAFFFSEKEDREDVLITGTHDYQGDELYLQVEEGKHNLVTLSTAEYDDTLDRDDIKKDILEHPEKWTLDGKPIEEINFHRYICDEEEDGTAVFQIEVVLYNK
jgi:hypothetical protein